ncbi:hypothetical protein [uncultured Gilliamella sp.]|uniref:hypothetical protein n=1 Tax=uncultured Gilliamella sp. TaxID=1193505 RepID=UPI0025F8E7F0|nr:hypothetical protein [uncultured Gilliamella sp.]
MASKVNRLIGQLGAELAGGLVGSLGGISHNRYTLTVESVSSPVSILRSSNRIICPKSRDKAICQSG